MSVTENQPKPNTNDDQLGSVKHPLRVFLTAIFAFLIPIGALILVLEYATDELRQGGSVHRLDHEALVERIQPVARVAFEPIEEETELKTGEEVYNMTCATCHTDGVAGAPKFGDEGEWAPYLETGYEALLEVALHGRGAMPAKGGNTALDDLEVERAMVYMANAAGAGFNEPGEEGAAEAQSAAAESETETTEVAAADSDEFAATDEQLAIGEELYKSSCFACHDAAVAGAPLFGSAEQWQPYVDTGLDAMLEVAINGKGAMPPRGASSASDDELKAAILYMVAANQSESDDTAATDEPASEADEVAESTEAAADGDEFAATDEQLAVGEQLYKSSCFACHDAAVAGAPLFGSAEQWQPYVDTGLDAMLEVAINGKGAMPPRGASSASDDELKAAILYMISENK